MPKVQGKAIGQESFLEKGTHRVDIAAGGLGPNATLNRQIAPVSLQHPFHWAAGRGRRRRWHHRHAAEVTENRLHRFDREEERITAARRARRNRSTSAVRSSCAPNSSLTSQRLKWASSH